MQHDKGHQPRLIKETPTEHQSDDAQKAEYRERLRQYLQDPDFRQIEGFPLGADEDILALSDPPYYTACPNPFLPEIIEQWQAERHRLRDKLGLPDDSQTDSSSYQREPLAIDVSAGKYHPFYRLHPYPTKVPHQAIMHYILHYTEPGDIVLDGFCGTGMTGVAAQFCSQVDAIEEIGYSVNENGEIENAEGRIVSRVGQRQVVLNDISSSAAFITKNIVTPVNKRAFAKQAEQLLEKVREECGWMYLTLHSPNKEQLKQAVGLLQSNDSGVTLTSERNNLPWGEINYLAWSDVFVCPACTEEFVFWDIGVDIDAGKVRDNFPCPQCKRILSKDDCERSWKTGSVL